MHNKKRNINEFGAFTRTIKGLLGSKATSNRGGFTLIELLVVVLIIGILSSIALPQYTKAVEKARAAEAMAFSSDWVTAQKIYKLANGHYARPGHDEPISSELDITLPTNQMKYFSVLDESDEDGAVLILTRRGSSTSYKLEVYLGNNPEDGSDHITRSCVGSICPSIVSGLQQATGASGGQGSWQIDDY